MNALQRLPLSPRQKIELVCASYIYDPDDQHATGDMMRELRTQPGTLYVSIPPADPSPKGALALAILEALGKDLDLQVPVDHHDAWRLAQVWMKVEKIRALIVIGADQLPAAVWDDLIYVHRNIPMVALILVHHQPGQERRLRQRLKAQSTIQTVTVAELRSWTDDYIACAAAGPDGERPSPRRAFPTVPDDEIPFFRARCRHLLSAEDFRAVDALYKTSYDSARRWLNNHDDIDEVCVGAHLAQWTAGMTLPQQITRLRGAQVAFLRRSWLLKVDLEALAGAHRNDSVPALDDEVVVGKLRAYAQPSFSAIAALVCAAGLSPAQLAILNADQISTAWPDAGQRNCDEPRLSVRAACTFVNAHLVDRAARGLPPDGPLFTSTTGRRLGHNDIRQLLRRITRESGLALVSNWTPPTGRQHQFWMRRRGLTLQPL